jgi:hypothetical protein
MMQRRNEEGVVKVVVLEKRVAFLFLLLATL